MTAFIKLLKKTGKNSVCIYCGETDDITKDHIPPKCLFPNPRPNNLITVPSCKKCNSGFSFDDEYFRLVLTIREDTFESETVQKMYPSVLRSLGKSNKIGFRKGLLESTFKTEHFSKAGLFLGYKEGYKIDLTRLENVISRVIKGLYFHHEKTKLPIECKIGIYITENLMNIDPQTLMLLNDHILPAISRNKLYSVGNVFEYKYAKADDKLFGSVWLIRFYEKITFLCFTIV